MRADVGPSRRFVETSGLSVGRARVLTVSGCSGEGPYLARFHADGSPYRFWPTSSVFATNVEPLGGALASGCGYVAAAQNGDFVGAGGAVVWFRANGLLDLRQPVSSLPRGALAASLVASREGAVLVASQRGTTTYISRVR